MDDSLVAEFTSITSASPAQAEQYLRVTDNNLEHAIQLFFEDPNLAAEPVEPTRTPASRPSHREDSEGVIHIDSDDDDVVVTGSHNVGGADTSEDAEIARQLQEELFSTANSDPEATRAPMLRTRETLVGHDDDYEGGDIDSMVQQQMRERERRRRDRQRELC